MKKFLIIIIFLIFFYGCGGDSSSDIQEPQCVDVTELLENTEDFSECLAEAMINLCPDNEFDFPIRLSCRYENDSEVIKGVITPTECEIVDCNVLQCQISPLFEESTIITIPVDQIFDTNEVIEFVASSTQQKVIINGDDSFEGGCGFGNSCLSLEDTFNGSCPTEDIKLSCTEIACNGDIPETENFPSVIFDCGLIPLFDDNCTVEGCNTLSCDDGSIWNFNNTNPEIFSSITLFIPDRDLTVGVGCGPCIFSEPTFNQ